MTPLSTAGCVVVVVGGVVVGTVAALAGGAVVGGDVDVVGAGGESVEVVVDGVADRCGLRTSGLARSPSLDAGLWGDATPDTNTPPATTINTTADLASRPRGRLLSASRLPERRVRRCGHALLPRNAP